jgi:protein TonB
MEIKKNPKYNLERKRGLFLNLGLLVAGTLTLAAFTYGVPTSEKDKKYEPERKIAKELYEVQPKIVEQKKQKSEPPKADPIFDPHKVTEVDKKDPDVDVSIIPDPFIPAPFMDLGKKGTGFGDPGDGNFTSTIFESEQVEQEPLFPGGEPEMIKFIQKKYKINNLYGGIEQGTIYVRLVITEQGEVSKVEIARGISPDLDKEAIRVVKSMPNWTPGKYRGRNVSVRMVIPIRIVAG